MQEEIRTNNQNSLNIKATLSMLNPAFYIKACAFVDEISLLKNCHKLGYNDFFEMPKNCLIFSGAMTGRDLKNIDRIYTELHPPKLLICIGPVQDQLKEKFEGIQSLTSDFSQQEYFSLVENMIRGQDV